MPKVILIFALCILLSGCATAKDYPIRLYDYKTFYDTFATYDDFAQALNEELDNIYELIRKER